MGWHVIDRNGRKWFPYIIMTPDDGHDVLLHHELDDTDMGDLFMRELTQTLGPVTVVAS